MASIPQHVQCILREALGTKAIVAEQPTGGAVAETFLLTLADGSEVVCKLGGENIWTGSVVEPFIVRLVAKRTSLPVPSVLASGSISGLDAVDRWAVYERLSGTVPRNLDREPKEALVDAAGTMLGQLHTAFTFDRISGFAAEDGRLRRVEPARKNLLTTMPARWLRRHRQSTPEFVLGHGDYQPGNLLFADGKITGLLDWGNAHITEALYAFARAEARFVDLTTRSLAERRRLQHVFRKAYRRSRSGRTLDMAAIPAYKSLWLLQSVRNLAGVAETEHGRTQLRKQFANWTERRGFSDAAKQVSKSIFGSRS